MNNANRCPICEKFILGNYCALCKNEINYTQNDLDKLKDLFGENMFNQVFGGNND